MSTFCTILVTTSLSRYSASIGGVVQSSGPRSMRVGQTYSVVWVVGGRHFRPTGLAPDEPGQEVEILDFLRAFSIRPLGSCSNEIVPAFRCLFFPRGIWLSGSPEFNSATQ